MSAGPSSASGSTAGALRHVLSHLITPLLMCVGMGLAYLGAFHAPAPHDLRVDVVGSGARAQVLAQTLQDKGDGALSVRTVANRDAAADLAAHYMLDKSTVSRQVATLEKLGLVERHPDPSDQRTQVLHPTAAGTEALASTQASRRAAYRERLGTWTSEDLEQFAQYLLRYNSTGEGSSPR